MDCQTPVFEVVLRTQVRVGEPENPFKQTPETVTEDIEPRLAVCQVAFPSVVAEQVTAT